MNAFLRAAIVPFCMALFPALWYIGRNLTTERLPPYVQPTTELLAVSVVLAILGAAVVGAILASLGRHGVEDERRLPIRRRLFQLDERSSRVFVAIVAVFLLWALFALFGPPWLEVVAYVVLVPFALPFFVLAPLAIHFHWAVVLGLVLSVVWMSGVSIAVSERVLAS